MSNSAATGSNAADRAAASGSRAVTNAVRRNSEPRTRSSNCWCSTMSQPCSNRNALTARTMPGRSGQLSVRMNVLVTMLLVPGWSALDDVEGEPAAGGLLVLVLHVRPGLAHGLDRLVDADLVAPV